ncbi:alpha/beta hydrolase fold domain-containing protein [Synechococcales cyanobacterium C]|uniref:Alpha/beta hydrolase fold domain-containing protein n=2 Tax=Petrachloros TaxID=2918834 RepID=A0A8K1ZZC5_9CYAN|nr:alpha/beta hydrolase fold domain-containing protein [Petrachloros mirabilis ULC683]
MSAYWVQVLIWLLAGGSVLLSIWIVLPAPTRFLLPLGVVMPEVSPWLVALSGISLVAVLFTQSQAKLASLALVFALLLSLLPLIQFPAANARMATEMQSVLGSDYLSQIPRSLQGRMRSHSFQLQDIWGGIALAPISIERGLVFAEPDGVPLKLNVYRPTTASNYPTLVIIYGGAWQGGTPNSHETFSRYIAAQGYTVVAIDYRHAPQYLFPSQLEDVQTALTYLKLHAAALGIDLTRLALMGRSAGAQLATIAAYQQSQSLPIRAVINYYGPVDLRAGYDHPPVPDPIEARTVLKAFLGGSPDQVPDLYRQASPIHYVRPHLPPTLLVYAGRDHVVEPRFGRQLQSQLQVKGNQAVLIEVPWSEHAFDLLFNGVGNQMALYYTERFLAWALYSRFEN